MTILIDNTNLSDLEQSILTQRGVSRRIFRIKFSLANQLQTIPAGDSEPDISWKTQEKWLDEVLKYPLAKPYLILITADTGEMLGRSLALTIVRTALSVHIQRAEQGETDQVAPLWNTIYGGRFGRARESYDRNSEEGRPCIVAIDNVQIDMQNDKADRVRDLLRVYEEAPRIVVATGCDPLSFVRRRYMPEPDMMFYLPSIATVYDREMEKAK